MEKYNLSNNQPREPAKRYGDLFRTEVIIYHEAEPGGVYETEV